jgi:peroxiredoxin
MSLHLGRAWVVMGILVAGLLGSLTTQTDAAEPPMPPKVGDTAPDFKLATPGGEAVQLATVLRQGPVVLVVLRGFPGYQCPICTKQVGTLIDKSKEFAEKKATLVLVYPGPADGLKEHADEFVRGKTLPANVTLVIDPDYTMIKQYGLRWDAPKETAYPSTFVLDSAGKIVLAKVSTTHGGRADVAEVLKAVP